VEEEDRVPAAQLPRRRAGRTRRGRDRAASPPGLCRRVQDASGEARQVRVRGGVPAAR
jgi:hypothetical protein